MTNAKQIWEETVKQLEKVYERREAENISYLFLEDAFEIPKLAILSSDPVAVAVGKLRQGIERLLRNEPVQYVTGVADFYGRKFRVEPGVLIPRPETEELVDLIIRENEIERPKILDVGVGSGCIAITLALEIQGKVWGMDASEVALKVASKNVRALNAEVELMQGNILVDRPSVQVLDILVSNPPYIPVADRDHMHPNVLDYEPEEALFVPNNDPLVFYREIAQRGQTMLKKSGTIYFEIHEEFSKAIAEILDKLGYKNVLIHKDMQGKNRVIRATNSANRSL